MTVLLLQPPSSNRRRAQPNLIAVTVTSVRVKAGFKSRGFLSGSDVGMLNNKWRPLLPLRPAFFTTRPEARRTKKTPGKAVPVYNAARPGFQDRKSWFTLSENDWLSAIVQFCSTGRRKWFHDCLFGIPSGEKSATEEK
jgi:hypothetical protein